ncbi:endophilin-B2-like [Spea bombifrons]|uniref:endophilin-B2-like n=1 Tax=Spea bombifrons TaxID=233779 RepID=UPI0023493B20|nr:endophilin-B2-like [Spea bombifrons]
MSSGSLPKENLQALITTLPKPVNQDQSGFVSGRQTSDNTRRLLNIFHYIEVDSAPALILALDAEKAFDRLRWSYAFSLWSDEVDKAEHELRVAQTEFDRQAEVTRLLLEGISSTHVNHLRCLHEFAEAQATYYAQCYQYMVDLQKQLGRFPATLVVNADSTPPPLSTSPPPATLPVLQAVSPNPGDGTLNAIDVKPPSSGTRKARVLYDYEAADSTELTLAADELITVYSLPGMDPDWLVGERGNKKGKVPVTYLELLS